MTKKTPNNNISSKTKATQIKPGQCLNPNGRPKGSKDAKTIVKDFMDNKIQSISGTKVSRFQYLLWSMYEINLRLMKQLDYRVEEVKQAEEKVKRLETNIEAEDKTNSSSASSLKLAENSLRSRNKEYENLLRQVQESQGKLSEFFLKASGQYLEKKEIETKGTQALLVTCGKGDIEAAMREIDDEC